MDQQSSLHPNHESPGERRRRVTENVRRRFGRSRWLAPLARFFAWWAGVFVFFAAMTVCPFCGQVGCIGGAASAGLFGGAGAFLISLMRRTWTKTSKMSVPGDRPRGEGADVSETGSCCRDHGDGGRT
jgi:hypothetical protein